MNKLKFTLLELLIVVAIIGILLTLLVPSLRRAREAAKFAVCKSNQTQQYRLLLTAANGNNGRLPQIDHKGFESCGIADSTSRVVIFSFIALSIL